MNYVLVDDEERALNLLRIMLTRSDGFSKEHDHIDTFTQPVEALDFIRRTLVDVIFLDIEMPVLNGITLGKQISEELPAPPEIIYVTAFPEYSLDAWDIGAFGYILKPYDPKQISAVLNRVLKYHAAAAASIASVDKKTGFDEETVRGVAKQVRQLVDSEIEVGIVIGDGNGHVGAGLGKAAEIPEAIRKGKEDAMKKLVSVAINENGSITHDYVGKFGSAEVLLKKAPEGTGVIAGGPARAVIELAGIKNIRTKSLGSRNKQNVVLATIAGLSELKTPEEVARLRGKSTNEIFA